jgi:hypothetical protein
MIPALESNCIANSRSAQSPIVTLMSFLTSSPWWQPPQHAVQPTDMKQCFRGKYQHTSSAPAHAASCTKFIS